ncbi:MAG: hypothetical protein RLZZ387_811 [Chloroflexota bacterium]|jgi:regulator of cell morphogenesis and NO signaling
MTTEPIVIDATEALNAIVAREPRTLEVFRRYGMDTCCGGALPLETAARHHDVDLGELLAALLEVTEGRK